MLSLDIFALLSFVTFVFVSFCLKAPPVTAGCVKTDSGVVGFLYFFVVADNVSIRSVRLAL